MSILTFRSVRTAAVPFAALGVALTAGPAASQIVAQQDFDLNNDALQGSFDPTLDNLDGGGGDFFGVGSACAWPQGNPPGVPFSIADDSVIDFSGCGANDPFPGDDEGIYGQNSDPDNNFFCISDTREWDQAQTTAEWIFDIEGAGPLEISIDIGADPDDDFSYDPGAVITFSASVGTGPAQVLFEFTPGTNNTLPGSLRPMDSGTNDDPPDLLYATGDSTITKTFADGGDSNDPADHYLDKTVVDTGLLDTYTTSIAGSGDTLTITMTTNLPFRGVTFDNIVIRETAGPICPDSGVLTAGATFSGGPEDVCDADGSLWVIQSTTFAASFAPAPTGAEFEGTVNPLGGDNLTLRMVGGPEFGNDAAFIQLRMWNYSTDSYVGMPFANQPDATDTVYEVTRAVADYVGPNGEVRAEITGAKTVDGPIRLRMDQVVWEVN